MRSSRQEMERHRSEIIDASSRLFRQKGVDNVSVPELMQAVGMTHGGFYKHFGSKDELVAVTYGNAFEQIVEGLRAAQQHAGDPGEAWNEFVSNYLSPQHRDNIAGGCATAAFAGDAARLGAGSPTQAAYESGVHKVLDAAGILENDPDQRAKSLAAISTMVGALLLSRGTTGALSDEFLAAARGALTKQSS